MRTNATVAIFHPSTGHYPHERGLLLPAEASLPEDDTAVPRGDNDSLRWWSKEPRCYGSSPPVGVGAHLVAHAVPGPLENRTSKGGGDARAGDRRSARPDTIRPGRFGLAARLGRSDRRVARVLRPGEFGPVRPGSGDQPRLHGDGCAGRPDDACHRRIGRRLAGSPARLPHVRRRHPRERPRHRR
jgi:hypothetical protein